MTIFSLTPKSAFYKSSASFDASAQTYITAVETADGQALESTTKTAINAFVVECKAQGIWTAIQASCILAGARTLSGALVPLKGTAPTNVNFVGGDYNRKTGLLGNGTTKYIDSNRAGSADPQNENHISVNTELASPFVYMMGSEGSNAGATNLVASGQSRSRNGTIDGSTITRTTPFMGISRSASTTYTSRFSGGNTAFTTTSQTPATVNYFIFAANFSGVPIAGFMYSNRINFYSIGTSIDLAKLDTAVTNLMTAISTAF